MISSCLRGTDGLMVVFDITDEHSFQNVHDQFHYASLHCNPDCIKLLVGNKTDLALERKVNAKVG